MVPNVPNVLRHQDTSNNVRLSLPPWHSDGNHTTRPGCPEMQRSCWQRWPQSTTKTAPSATPAATTHKYECQQYGSSCPHRAKWGEQTFCLHTKAFHTFWPKRYTSPQPRATANQNCVFRESATNLFQRPAYESTKWKTYLSRLTCECLRWVNMGKYEILLGSQLWEYERFLWGHVEYIWNIWLGSSVVDIKYVSWASIGDSNQNAKTFRKKTKSRHVVFLPGQVG